MGENPEGQGGKDLRGQILAPNLDWEKGDRERRNGYLSSDTMPA